MKIIILCMILNQPIINFYQFQAFFYFCKTGDFQRIESFIEYYEQLPNRFMWMNMIKHFN